MSAAKWAWNCTPRAKSDIYDCLVFDGQSETDSLCHGASTWRTGQNNVVLDFGPLAPLCEIMLSSTKPEIHNILHFRHSRIE